MLGAFHDFGVQEQYLTAVTGELKATGRQTEKTVAATVVLMKTVRREKRKVKDAFFKTFTEYASPENKRAFREMFATKESERRDS
jgi:hypothetical protein